MDVANQLVMRFTTYVIDPAIKILLAAAFFLFMYGLVEFLWNLDKGGEQDEGKQHMLWGVIGFFVMVSAAAIITILMNTFGLDASGTFNSGDVPNPVPFGQQ